MEEQLQAFDICILCALYEEARAVIDEFEARCNVTFTKAFRGLNRLEYRHAVIQNQRGESLTIFVTWLSDMGPIRTALDIKPLLQEITPRFVAMTGLCAGDRRKVKLGDLIVATYAYHPEEGKIMTGSDGQSVHLPETRTVGATTQVVQYVRGFDHWREPVRALKRQQLKRAWKATDEPACHIEVMASSMAVHADNPFPQLTMQHNRKTFGIDMEAATFYAALHDFPLMRGLVVKGVSDYGDRRKTDRYRDYARRASAVYLLCFIREYVTEETMPRQEAKPPPVFTVRAQRDPFFTGREALLQSLHRLLTPGSVTAITQAISGMGGIGKTHTAIEYAYRFRPSYQAILWLPADSWENVLSGCFTLVTALGLSEEKEADRALAAVQRWLREHRRWLLILDNVEQAQEILPRFLPAGHHGCVLITTRLHHIEPFAQTQVMDLMTETEGVLFLLRRTALLSPTAPPDQALPAQREEAQQIWELLGGLPLALDQAGAYILETGCAFSAYREHYEIRRATLLSRRGWRFVGHETSVATTFSLAAEKAEARSPLAAVLLRICALLDNEAIPEELFADGAEPLGLLLMQSESLDEALGVLQDYSLIQRNREGKTLSVHRLVQAVLQDTLEEAERRSWTERAMLAVNATFPRAEYGTWVQCERLLPHALRAARYIETYQVVNEQAGRLLHETAVYLRDHARYSEAEPLFQRALQIRERLLGSEHPDVATSLHGLANLYFEQGKYEQAEPLYQRALTIREKAFGTEHQETAMSFYGLADLYLRQGKYEQAELFFQRTLVVREKVFGAEHPETAICLNDLATLYVDQDKNEQAEYLLQRVLAIYEKTLGDAHPEVAISLYNLGYVYIYRGKYEQAEPLLQRALTIREKAFGTEHQETAMSFYGLAGLYLKQGKYEQAEPLYRHALAVFEKILGDSHLSTIVCLENMALLYMEQDKYEQAESLYQRALALSEQALGAEHIETANSLWRLANLYEKQGKYEQAKQYCQRALAVFEKILGAEHSYIVNTRKFYAHLLQILSDNKNRASSQQS